VVELGVFDDDGSSVEVKVKVEVEEGRDVVVGRRQGGGSSVVYETGVRVRCGERSREAEWKRKKCAGSS
jgi:hypothetical protein